MKVLLLGEGSAPNREALQTVYPENFIQAGSGEYPHEIVTFGFAPGVDVCITPQQDMTAVLARLPDGWRPDLCVLWLPEWSLLPRGLDRCGCPTVAYFADWDYDIDLTRQIVGEVDLVLTIAEAEARWVERLGGRAASLYSQGVPSELVVETPRPLAERSIDILYTSFVDDLAHPDRSAWMVRLAELGSRYEVRIVPPAASFGAYLDLLDDARLAFSMQRFGSMSNRALEALARGCVALDPGAHVDEHLLPGAEYVALDASCWQRQLEATLSDLPQLQRIADAGHAAVRQRFESRQRFSALLDFARQQLPERAPDVRVQGRPDRAVQLYYAAFRCRGVPKAKVLEAARGVLDEAVEKHPSPRDVTNLVVSSMAHGLLVAPEQFASEAAPRLVETLDQLLRTHPDYAPAAAHRAVLLARIASPLADGAIAAALAVLARPQAMVDDGCLLPQDFELYQQVCRRALNRWLLEADGDRERDAALRRGWEGLLLTLAARQAEAAGQLDVAYERYQAALERVRTRPVLAGAARLAGVLGALDAAQSLHLELLEVAPLTLDPHLALARLLHLRGDEQPLLDLLRRLTSVTATVTHLRGRASELRALIDDVSRGGPVNVVREELLMAWVLDARARTGVGAGQRRDAAAGEPALGRASAASIAPWCCSSARRAAGTSTVQPSQRTSSG